MQIEFDFTDKQEKIPANPQVKHLPYGKLFKFVGKKGYFLRVKPTGYILNSELVADVLNRRDVFVTSVERGTLYIVEGNKEVIEIESSIVIKE